MDTILQDIRYAVRILLKNPFYTAMTLMTLALGIGANTVIFSAVNAILIRPMPYANPSQVVYLWNTEPERGLDLETISLPDFQDYRDQTQTLDQIAALFDSQFNIAVNGEPEQVAGSRLTANLLPMLGTKPLYGRIFLPEEEQPGKHRVVILSHRLWQRRFNADPNIIDKAITVQGVPYTVVGIMPPNFNFPGNENELWVPLALRASAAERGNRFLTVVARIKPNATFEQAEADTQAIAQRLEQQYKEDKGVGIKMIPLKKQILGTVSLGLQVLQGAVAFVLLIACANVASLLLAKGAARDRETAIRIALGATRKRLIQQLLTESLVLGLLGAALGIALSYFGIQILKALAPSSIPRIQEVSLDLGVLLFTFILSIITSVLFGLAPALQTSKPDLNHLLKEGGRSSSVGVRGRKALRMLVVSEIALALILLVGAGLLINSFVRLRLVNPGFNPDHVLTMQINLPGSKYRKDVDTASFYQRLLTKVSALPGVQSAGITQALPLGGGDRYFMDLNVEGRDSGPVREGTPPVALFQISPDFFKTIGTPLLRGRDLAEQDIAGSPVVAIITESLAGYFFPNEDPLGKKVRVGGPGDWSVWAEVVGIVPDVRFKNLNRPPAMQIYTSHNQGVRIGVSLSMMLAVRTEGDPNSLATAIREQVWSIDKDQPVAKVSTMTQLVSDALSEPRFNMALLGAFGVVALILAAVGISGVLSYSVAQRTHEIGVRLALGAQPIDLLKMLVGEGMLLAVLGIIAGLAASFALTRLMVSLLFGVKATDLLTFAATSLVLVVVALAACYLPARRATKLNPVTALRYE
jgi:putative ABC transport system permease protein